MLSNIPPEVLSRIRDGYHYVCERSEDFDFGEFSLWAGRELPKRPVYSVNCMCQSSVRHSPDYVVFLANVGRPDSTRLLGFKTEEERTLALAVFPELTVPEIYRNALYWHD